jgi:nucleotide-binding universal stress UspA family protein
MVPPNVHCEALGKRLVVGWDGSRAANRSVNDALPIIERADATDIVIIDPMTEDFAYEDHPGAELAEHLGRHGCRVNIVRLPKDASAAEMLCRHALNIGADLVVAGCYGHSRIGEWFLGGATRALLRQATLPVLMSF